MMVCGNVPPLKPLWDRFVAGTLDSNYAPIKHNLKNSHSKLTTHIKPSSSGENSHTLLSQHDEWSQSGPKEFSQEIKSVTDIHFVRSTSMV